jgi:hypothetical protein
MSRSSNHHSAWLDHRDVHWAHNIDLFMLSSQEEFHTYLIISIIHNIKVEIHIVFMSLLERSLIFKLITHHVIAIFRDLLWLEVLELLSNSPIWIPPWDYCPKYAEYSLAFKGFPQYYYWSQILKLIMLLLPSTPNLILCHIQTAPTLPNLLARWMVFYSCEDPDSWITVETPS